MLAQRYVVASPAHHLRPSDATVVRFSDHPAGGGLLLGVGWDDGLVTVHRGSSGALLHTVGVDAAAADAAGAPHTSRGGLPVTCLRWRPRAPSPVLLAGGSDGTLRHIDGATGALMGASVVEARNEIHSLDCRADGGAFATGGKDGAVRVYDEEKRALVVKLTGNASAGAEHFHDTNLASPLQRRGVAVDRFESLAGGVGTRLTSAGGGHSNRVYAVAWHPSSGGHHEHGGEGSFGDARSENILTSGSVDNTVNVWDVRLGGSVRTFFDCNIAGDGLTFSPDGRFLFTASHRNQEQLQVWDWVAGKLLCDIPWVDSSEDAASHLAAQRDSIAERLSGAPVAAKEPGNTPQSMASVSRDGPVGSSLYSVSLSRAAAPLLPDVADPWDSAFLLVGGNSIHEAKVYCVSSVFAAAGLHDLLGTSAVVAPEQSAGTLWASAMYRVRRRASLAKGVFHGVFHTQAALVQAAAAKLGSSGGGGGGGGGAVAASAAAPHPPPAAHGAKPKHHAAHTPRALLPGGFPIPAGTAPAPLVGTVNGFAKALYSVHWAPGGGGFAVAAGTGAYVFDLALPQGGADWVKGSRASHTAAARPPP